MQDRHPPGPAPRSSSSQARVWLDLRPSPGRAHRRAGWPARGLALLSLACATGTAAQVVVVSDAEHDPPADLPDRHQVGQDETLYMLAERYLENGDAWPKLWSYNPEITNPHWIYPGHILRLKAGVDLNAPAAAGAGAGPASAGGPKTAVRSLGFRRPPQRATGAVLLGEEVYLDRDALAQAARIVGSSEDHLMLSPSDEVYLQFKPEAPAPEQGKELTVFLRQHRAEVAPKAGKQRVYTAGDGGEIVRVRGALRVKSFDPKRRIARAVVIEALDPIERGFEVADVPRHLLEVPPKPNGRDLRAKIVAATRALSTLGDGQLVFIDAGSKHGVEVGNRFQVVRQGDPWRQQLTLREDLTGAERPDPHPPADGTFPPEVVAELRVLYVRPGSSTALITSSWIEINPGERVEMRAGY